MPRLRLRIQRRGNQLMSQTTHNIQDIETIAILTRKIDDQDKQLRAKEKLIMHLNFLLAQKTEYTEKSFAEQQEKIGQCEDQVKLLFMENPRVGLSYNDARDLFKEKFHYEMKNIDRRMRQLREDGFLWSSDEEDGEVRYYLKLKNPLQEVQVATI